MDAIRIIVDSREPPSVRGLLAAHREVDMRVALLPVANFVVGPDAAVERKTADDFVRSILDGRFASQSARLRDTYPRVLWVIEGDPFSSGVGISQNALAGALTHLAAMPGTSLLRTDAQDQTVALIVAMARQLQKGRHADVAPRLCKPDDPDRLAEFIVGGLPGIGRRRAQQLLQHFGSVAAVFRADPADIAALPGFGRRSAGSIKAALERRYHQPSVPAAGAGASGAAAMPESTARLSS